MEALLGGSVFYQISAVLLVAAACGALGVILRQPLIVAFIAVGILVGPAGLGIVAASDQVDLLAKMGIALLLFVVGLKLDVHVIRTVGPVALATGLGQVAFTSILGFVICLGLGLSVLSAVYVAVALTFSSTIIIVKLLSDKREIDALHGRIAVGFLIVQDIAVVVAMIGITALGAPEATDLGVGMLVILTKGLGFLLAVALMMRFVLPWLVHRLARSHELLVLFAIAWAVTLASLGDGLGFSKEVGAFLAGISLASTPYRETIGTRLVSLRDFLLLFFFIDLGSRLELGMLGAQAGSAVVLSLFVLIGNPLIVMVIMGFMGYRKRTGFLAGLTVAQISEFSLILAALGVTVGHLDPEGLGLVTLVGLITISLSTYMIIYSHKLYRWLAPMLGVFERRVPHRELSQAAQGQQHRWDVVIFGVGRYGAGIAHGLMDRGLRVLGVDFDPETVRHASRRGLMVHYGDAEDPEFPGTLPLGELRCVVSTSPTVDVNLALIQALKHHGYRGPLAVTAHNARDADLLAGAGATLVLMPFKDAASQAAHLLARSVGAGEGGAVND